MEYRIKPTVLFNKHLQLLDLKSKFYWKHLPTKQKMIYVVASGRIARIINTVLVSDANNNNDSDNCLTNVLLNETRIEIICVAVGYKLYYHISITPSRKSKLFGQVDYIFRHTISFRSDFDFKTKYVPKIILDKAYNEM